ncbi:Quinone oxidoreductase 1 [Alphaproteobacteria bacterium SO-S41]|nr:Quinone oxidoreductase 1 [Alphaproteobacteria bacterium SO-S41]
MKAIRFAETGGPEVLRFEEIDLPAPSAGEIRVRHTAIGINYIDTYHRSGLYPLKLPSGIGMEAAGVVESVGPGVTDLKPGDRIAYGNGPIGAYAESANLVAARVVKLPEGVSDDIGASIMLKGLTAEYLLRRTYPLKAGETILFHAAAGGVGQIACQWAKALGATVIGTVGSDAKIETAKANGCDHVIVSSREDIAARVKEITGGAGVPVVYDGVGKDTWEASIKALKLRGLFASFGNASGPVPPFSPALLSPKSLYMTRPGLMAYVGTTEELRDAAAALFAVIASGAVKVAAPTVYQLADAATAHRDLEARKTTGSLILRP